MGNERDELMARLEDMHTSGNADTIDIDTAYHFILADRRRCLEEIENPLKDCIKRHNDCFGGKDPSRYTNEDKAIDEALKVIERMKK